MIIRWLLLLSLLPRLALARPNFQPRLYVAEENAIRVYPLEAQGNQPPLRSIQGPHTGLDNPGQMAWYEDELFVVQKNSLLVFDLNAEGDSVPRRIIRGGKTLLEDGSSLVIWSNEIFVSSTQSDWILVFGKGDSGNVAPRRTLWGASSGLHWPRGLAVWGQELVVANKLEHQIAFFPLLADGDCPPLRTLEGFRSPHQLAVVDDQLFVSENYGSQILRYPAKSSVPDSWLVHPDLQAPSGITSSPKELFLASFATRRVLVYPKAFQGTSPLRQLQCHDSPHSILVAPGP